MPFKDIFILSSGGHFVQRSKRVSKILVEDIMANISVKILLNLDQWFRRSHLKILLFSVFAIEQKDLCNFGREYYEEHFCEVILNLGQ